MVDPLQFGRLTDARRARPRRFRLFNAHLEEYLSENEVKSRLADLLSNDLARNTVFPYALRSPWALTIRSKFRGEFPEISMDKWYSLFPVWKTIIFQWLLGLNHKYRSKQNTAKSTSWLFTDHNSIQFQFQFQFIYLPLRITWIEVKKKKKLFRLSWLGSPKEASELIENGLPQINN